MQFTLLKGQKTSLKNGLKQRLDQMRLLGNEMAWDENDFAGDYSGIHVVLRES